MLSVSLSRGGEDEDVQATGKPRFEVNIVDEGRNHVILPARLKGVFVISDLCAVAKHFQFASDCVS